MAKTTITIEVSIEHPADEDFTETAAWELITSQINEGYISGMDSNESESYEYTVDVTRADS